MSPYTHRCSIGDVLDQHTKNETIAKLSKIQYNGHIKSQIDNVIKQLEMSKVNPQLQYMFKHYTDHYDSIRDRKFINTFPELKEFYENIL